MTDDKFSDPVEARKKAMDYLARREYGHGELVARLEKAGFNPEVCRNAVDQLVRNGLQSDARFAESFIRSRLGQGKGPARIRLELRQRRVADVDIDNALSEVDADWRALAREVRLRKFGPGRPEDFAARAKQMRFLQYRGFEQDQIEAAVSTDDDSA